MKKGKITRRLRILLLLAAVSAAGRTFVPVYDLGGSLARIDGGSGRVCPAGGQTAAAVRTECSAAPQEAELLEDGLQPAQRPVIVIDAGHGGMDGGASSTEGVREKDINLAIAQVSGGRGSAVSGRGHHDAHR